MSFKIYSVPCHQSVIHLSRGFMFWCKPVVHKDDNLRRTLAEFFIESLLEAQISTTEADPVEAKPY